MNILGLPYHILRSAWQLDGMIMVLKASLCSFFAFFPAHDNIRTLLSVGICNDLNGTNSTNSARNGMSESINTRENGQNWLGSYYFFVILLYHTHSKIMYSGLQPKQGQRSRGTLTPVRRSIPFLSQADSRQSSTSLLFFFFFFWQTGASRFLQTSTPWVSLAMASLPPPMAGRRPF